jgi:N-acetyl sugar amidotransferase
MDTSDPNIKFDEKGVCERCNDYYNHILPMWNKGEGKQAELNAIVEKIKEAGKRKKYDCLLGLSGGFDSSYMLHFVVKELKLRPLVFHVNAGWNLPVAEENIKKMVEKLGIDLKTEVINWNEVRDFQLAYFKSGVPHLDIPQDLAFVSVLDKFAVKNKIKYVLNGGNISTEVIVNPNAWGYWGTDMAQNKDVLKQFGTVEMKTYPFTNIIKRKIIVPYIKGIKVVKLLNSIPYIKKEAEKILMDEYGFVPYKQKHFESLMTKFIEGYWLPKRFGYDVRRPQFSSLILTGQMTREEAVEKMKQPAIAETEATAMFEQIAIKLEISTSELQQYFTMPLKTYKDYKNQEDMFAMGAKFMKAMKLDKLIRK